MDTLPEIIKYPRVIKTRKETRGNDGNCRKNFSEQLKSLNFVNIVSSRVPKNSFCTRASSPPRLLNVREDVRGKRVKCFEEITKFGKIKSIEGIKKRELR